MEADFHYHLPLDFLSTAMRREIEAHFQRKYGEAWLKADRNGDQRTANNIRHQAGQECFRLCEAMARTLVEQGAAELERHPELMERT